MPHDLQPPEGADQATQTVAADDQEPMLWCPVCSTRLEQRKCKLFCQKCGYYMSCADYY
jgi:Zn finger protein HypA/HybF involved in hydrogenase expression